MTSDYQSTGGQHEGYNSSKAASVEPMTQDSFLNNNNGSTSYAIEDSSEYHGHETLIVGGIGNEYISRSDKKGGDK